jgi:hypothetical protein
MQVGLVAPADDLDTPIALPGQQAGERLLSTNRHLIDREERGDGDVVGRGVVRRAGLALATAGVQLGDATAGAGLVPQQGDQVGERTSSRARSSRIRW